MKKIRLTETELTNIVKRVINEQPTGRIHACGAKGIKEMNTAFKSGGLTKVEFDYDDGAAYVTNNKGGKCGVGLNELKNIFM